MGMFGYFGNGDFGLFGKLGPNSELEAGKIDGRGSMMPMGPSTGVSSRHLQQRDVPSRGVDTWWYLGRIRPPGIPTLVGKCGILAVVHYACGAWVVGAAQSRCIVPGALP